MLLLENICLASIALSILVSLISFMLLTGVSISIVNDEYDLGRIGKLYLLFRMVLVSFVISLLIGVAVFAWPLTFLVAIYYVTSGRNHWIRKIGPKCESFINNFVG